jgi:hypothetical protein
MKFYKAFTIPCTVSIPQVQQTAMLHGATLLACNDADITGLCQEELAYVGPESQSLLFWIHASSEGLAVDQLESIKVALLRQSYVIGTSVLQQQTSARIHTHITIATDHAMNSVSALLDRLADALTDLEENGYALAGVEKKHYVVSATSEQEMSNLKSELAKIDGVALLQSAICEACGRTFFRDYGYYDEGEYSYCSDCCRW